MSFGSLCHLLNLPFEFVILDLVFYIWLICWICHLNLEFRILDLVFDFWMICVICHLIGNSGIVSSVKSSIWIWNFEYGILFFGYFVDSVICLKILVFSYFQLFVRFNILSVFIFSIVGILNSIQFLLNVLYYPDRIAWECIHILV